MFVLGGLYSSPWQSDSICVFSEVTTWKRIHKKAAEPAGWRGMGLSSKSACLKIQPELKENQAQGFASAFLSRRGPSCVGAAALIGSTGKRAPPEARKRPERQKGGGRCEVPLRPRQRRGPLFTARPAQSSPGLVLPGIPLAARPPLPTTFLSLDEMRAGSPTAASPGLGSAGLPSLSPGPPFSLD